MLCYYSGWHAAQAFRPSRRGLALDRTYLGGMWVLDPLRDVDLLQKGQIYQSNEFRHYNRLRMSTPCCALAFCLVVLHRVVSLLLNCSLSAAWCLYLVLFGGDGHCPGRFPLGSGLHA